MSLSDAWSTRQPLAINLLGAKYSRIRVNVLTRTFAFVAVVLKPELFEGLRFDFTKPLNQNFALSHRYTQPRGSAPCATETIAISMLWSCHTGLPTAACIICCLR